MISVFLFLPYTLLLFCGHWLQAFSNRWMFSWLNKIKPFMDAYSAPYKKHTRSWIGLLLTIRCIMFLVSALNILGNNKLTLLVIISASAPLATLAWVHHQIYKKLYNDNYLGSLFYPGLALNKNNPAGLKNTFLL